mmetsp:Transcript_6795/g.9920  ORF Transcript_6795/g.9920 Transcript_6795/m.9920 type:complete len:230 (-) Transcript_6795:143-832(-)|eukprot:CAMPEP_0194242292 /NCGR_PEP_ID=MMETSP0158-20130606/7872_1 /TAXON_ID=33649 /ORGANISM="Thalassionema nitzschioides, Strain L26-B" /LENGTH=229 /DNA_ID=CAMNT_0038977351 /DNA_START=46 /DNA_END=735 /DNA_ORIENTATION=-
MTSSSINTSSSVEMPSVDIKAVLSSAGPVVDAVLLPANASDSTVEAIKIDTTPKKQAVAKVLGGPFTFLGQYEEEGIILMIRKENIDNLATNPHKLQPPFHDTEVKGDILVMKVAAEEDAESASNEEFFLNYTKEEYCKFASRTDVVAPPMQPMETDDEEEESDVDEEDDESIEGEEDDEDEDDGESFINLLMGQVLKKFTEDNGREPDEQELQALKSAIAQKMGLANE